MRRYRGLFMVGSAVLALAVISASAEAQRQGGQRGRGGGGFPGMRGGFGGGGIAGLLQVQEVRDELKLSDEQVGKLVRLREEGGQQRPDFARFRDMSEEEREREFAKMREEREKQVQDMEKKIAEVLSKEQFKRVKQIELQQQGVRALLRDDIVQALGITEEQKEGLQAASDGMRDKMMEIFRGGGEMEPEARRSKMQELQTELQKKSMTVLGDEQKAKFAKIMGEPFAMPQRDFGRGGFRGRGDGQGGGRPGEGQGGDRPRRPRRPEA